MGCDIHFFVEIKQDDGSWKSADVWEREEDYNIPIVPYEKSFYRGRNYDLFAILANVRNGYGFVGIETGQGFNFISEPKGLPENVSDEVMAQSERWGEDGHSHSWLTLSELKQFNWEQVTAHYGYVGLEEYKTYLKRGSPNSWSGDVFGSRIRKISLNEMNAILKDKATAENGKLEADCSYVTRISWVEKYRESVGSFITETIPRMEALGDPENVRCVFWFDEVVKWVNKSFIFQTVVKSNSL